MTKIDQIRKIIKDIVLHIKPTREESVACAIEMKNRFPNKQDYGYGDAGYIDCFKAIGTEATDYRKRIPRKRSVFGGLASPARFERAASRLGVRPNSVCARLKKREKYQNIWIFS